MTDRELLILAAKAAGVVFPDPPSFTPNGALIISNKYGYYDFWNPLEEDGVAFRLAVKLGIEFRFFLPLSTNRQCTEIDVEDAPDIVEFHDSDPCAATRRAIVRAAAEIELRKGQNDE